MIAMQYGFTFPADYDMKIIRHRIATRGAALNGFPGLRFKCYLLTERGSGGAEFNRYAPFYLWTDPAGMHAFLRSPGFSDLVADFGRPSVRIWSISDLRQTEALRDARWATIRQQGINEKDVVPKQCNKHEQASEEMFSLLARVNGFDPAAWTTLDFRLWAEMPAPRETDAQCWEVGYVALG